MKIRNQSNWPTQFVFVAISTVVLIFAANSTGVAQAKPNKYGAYLGNPPPGILSNANAGIISDNIVAG